MPFVLHVEGEGKHVPPSTSQESLLSWVLYCCSALFLSGVEAIAQQID